MSNVVANFATSSAQIAPSARVQLDALAVAHHQHGRIVQGACVILQLHQGWAEVLVWAFVLPGEAAALPYIGKTFAADHFFQSLLVAVIATLAWRFDTEQAAEVFKVRLGAALL